MKAQQTQFYSKKLWTQQEDQVLREVVDLISNDKWTQISNLFNEKVKQVIQTEKIVRSGKQCRQRWYNRLDPALQNSSKWTVQEDEALFELYNKFGHKWLKIVNGLVEAGFARRSDNNVKNHFHSSVRKSVRELNKFIYYNNSQVKQSQQFKKNKKKYIYEREYSIQKLLKKQKKSKQDDLKQNEQNGQKQNFYRSQKLNRIQEMDVEQQNEENFPSSVAIQNNSLNFDNENQIELAANPPLQKIQQNSKATINSQNIYKDLFPDLKQQKISKLLLLCQQKEQNKLQLMSTLLQHELVQIRTSFINYMRNLDTLSHEDLINLIKNIQKVNKSCKRINKRTLAKVRREKNGKISKNKQSLIKKKVNQIYETYLEKMQVKIKLPNKMKKKILLKIEQMVVKVIQSKQFQNQNQENIQCETLQIDSDEEKQILEVLQANSAKNNLQNHSAEDLNYIKQTENNYIKQTENNKQVLDNIFDSESIKNDNQGKKRSQTVLTGNSNNQNLNTSFLMESKTLNKSFQNFNFFKQTAIDSPFKQIGVVIPNFKSISAKNFLNDSGSYAEQMFGHHDISKSIGYSEIPYQYQSQNQQRKSTSNINFNGNINNNFIQDFSQPKEKFASQISNPFNFFAPDANQINDTRGNIISDNIKQANLQKSLVLKNSNNFQYQDNNNPLLTSSLNLSNKSSFKRSLNYENQPKIQRFDFQNSNFLSKIACKELPEQPCFFDFTKSQNLFANIPEIKQQSNNFPFISQQFDIPKKLIETANSPGFPYVNFNEYSWNYNQNQSNLSHFLQKQQQQQFGFNSARLSDVDFNRQKQNQKQASKRSKSKDSSVSNMFHSQKFFPNSLQRISSSQGYKIKKNEILSNSCILSVSKADQLQVKQQEQFI